MIMDCVDHLNFTNEVCPDCSLKVDNYGNTEGQPLDYCSFPDCGCDGARLCMAKEGASDNAAQGNVEGMWSNGSNKACRKAAFFTMGLVLDKSKNN
jgi:hypothetical protein